MTFLVLLTPLVNNSAPIYRFSDFLLLVDNNCYVHYTATRKATSLYLTV